MVEKTDRVQEGFKTGSPALSVDNGEEILLEKKREYGAVKGIGNDITRIGNTGNPTFD